MFVSFIAAVLIYGCAEHTNNSSFESSLQPYLELERIESASNSDFIVNRGTAKGLDSYFSFDIKNIGNYKLIPDADIEGWCLEWNMPIASNGDTHHGVEIFSTYGSNSWRPANYLFNIIDDLKAEDPALTYREIQIALWSVIDEPRFELDKVIANGDLPSRLMRDGEPNFSVDRVNRIVDRVRTESPDFTYTAESNFLLYSNKGNNTQNGGTPVKCGKETAWSNGTQYGGGNWAMYHTYKGGETVKLLAGQTHEVGEVKFSEPVNGKVTITINMFENGRFQDTGENVKIQGYSSAPNGNPAAGRFDYKRNASGDSFEIEVPEYKYYGVHVDAVKCEASKKVSEEVL